jgi:uncharacterized protein DUF6886
MAWTTGTSSPADRERILGPGGYTLLRLPEEAGIQLRVLANLWPFWNAVVESTLGFSGIRLRNAAP